MTKIFKKCGRYKCAGGKALKFGALLIKQFICGWSPNTYCHFLSDSKHWLAPIQKNHYWRLYLILTHLKIWVGFKMSLNSKLKFECIQFLSRHLMHLSPHQVTRCVAFEPMPEQSQFVVSVLLREMSLDNQHVFDISIMKIKQI